MVEIQSRHLDNGQVAQIKMKLGEEFNLKTLLDVLVLLQLETRPCLIHGERQ